MNSFNLQTIPWTRVLLTRGFKHKRRKVLSNCLNKWQSSPNSFSLFSIPWPEHSSYKSVVLSICSDPSNDPLSHAMSLEILHTYFLAVGSSLSSPPSLMLPQTCSHLWAPARPTSSAQNVSPDHLPSHFLISFVFTQRSPAQRGLPGSPGLKLQCIRSVSHSLFFSMALTSIYSYITYWSYTHLLAPNRLSSLKRMFMQHLEQCLAHNGCSKSMYWMKEQMWSKRGWSAERSMKTTCRVGDKTERWPRLHPLPFWSLSLFCPTHLCLF